VTSVAGGGGQPARDAVGTTPRAGIVCTVCTGPVTPDDQPYAWTDPGGNQCVAHPTCLVNLGERDLDLGRRLR